MDLLTKSICNYYQQIQFTWLKPELREGKILLDIEEIHGLSCMITTATRARNHS